MYEYSYKIPENFDKRVLQFLKQKKCTDVANAFSRIKHEYTDEGLAYYAGLKGDNWNKHALDFVLEGSSDDIEVLESNKDALKDSISKALKSDESGLLVRNIYFFDCDDNTESDLPKTNEERLNADIEMANSVCRDIVRVGEKLCLNRMYDGSVSEDSINDYVRDQLEAMGYKEIKDQTRHGISLSGKDAGEVDILLEKDSKEIAIYEGLRLTSVDSKTIREHIDKSIVNYNALGTATFIVAYVNSGDFQGFWTRFKEYVMKYEFPLPVKSGIDEPIYPNAAIRTIRMVLSRDAYDFPVYFIAINIRKK